MSCQLRHYKTYFYICYVYRTTNIIQRYQNKVLRRKWMFVHNKVFFNFNKKLPDIYHSRDCNIVVLFIDYCFASFYWIMPVQNRKHMNSNCVVIFQQFFNFVGYFFPVVINIAFVFARSNFHRFSSKLYSYCHETIYPNA